MDEARSMDVLLAGIIAATRLDAGFTQADLARLLERPQSYVSKIEAGDRRVGAVELVLIARTLGRSAGDMLAGLPPAPAARVRRKPRESVHSRGLEGIAEVAPGDITSHVPGDEPPVGVRQLRGAGRPAAVRSRRGSPQSA